MAKTILLADTLEALIAEKKYNTLKDILTTMNPADIAALLEDASEQVIVLLFRLLPKELAAETFVEMESDSQEVLIKGFSDRELKEVLDELFADDVADIIEEMPSNIVTRILRQADSQMRRDVNQLLKYPQDTAGSIMTTEFVSFSSDMTAEKAIEKIRREGVDKETINTCYVTDPVNHLEGIVSIRRLILARPEEHIRDIMDENVISAVTTADQSEVAQMFQKYNFLALPIVDAENRIVGIVTFDDAMDVIEEEATEDIEIMAAITPSDKPYMRTSVFELWRHRIPWLLLLMISATLTGMIITHFETALSACIVLTAYIPMLMDTGGNSGSQASATVIRALSLGELEFSDTIAVIWKEIRVAVMCGVTLAACNFVKLMVLDRIGVAIALTVSVTLAFTVLVAKVVGCTLPMIAEKVGFDPAVMASPLITTIVDALSLIIYFWFATMLLGI